MMRTWRVTLVADVEYGSRDEWAYYLEHMALGEGVSVHIEELGAKP